MADHGLSPALQLLDLPGPLPPTLVTGINAVDPCILPFASCTELVRSLMGRQSGSAARVTRFGVGRSGTFAVTGRA